MADFSQAVQDIVARLYNNEPMVNGQPVWVRYPNGGGNNPESEPWVRLTVVPLGRADVTADSQPWIREDGFITLDVFTPIGKGVNTNTDILKQLTALFENKEFGVVKTWAAPKQIIPEEPGSAWFGYQINVNFYVEGK